VVFVPEEVLVKIQISFSSNVSRKYMRSWFFRKEWFQDQSEIQQRSGVDEPPQQGASTSQVRLHDLIYGSFFKIKLRQVGLSGIPMTVACASHVFHIRMR
jgi:hypothetical protein